MLRLWRTGEEGRKSSGGSSQGDLPVRLWNSESHPDPLRMAHSATEAEGRSVESWRDD